MTRICAAYAGFEPCGAARDHTRNRLPIRAFYSATVVRVHILRRGPASLTDQVHDRSPNQGAHVLEWFPAFARPLSSGVRAPCSPCASPAPTRTADGHHVVTNAVSHFANRKQSLRSFSGGGGNRTAGSSSDSDDSPTVSRTGIDENTSKEHEQNALPDILMTMSQIPDVNRELAEVGAVIAVIRGVKSEAPMW